MRLSQSQRFWSSSFTKMFMLSYSFHTFTLTLIEKYEPKSRIFNLWQIHEHPSNPSMYHVKKIIPHNQVPELSIGSLILKIRQVRAEKSWIRILPIGNNFWNTRLWNYLLIQSPNLPYLHILCDTLPCSCFGVGCHIIICNCQPYVVFSFAFREREQLISFFFSVIFAKPDLFPESLFLDNHKKWQHRFVILKS